VRQSDRVIENDNDYLIPEVESHTGMSSFHIYRIELTMALTSPLSILYFNL